MAPTVVWPPQPTLWRSSHNLTTVQVVVVSGRTDARYWCRQLSQALAADGAPGVVGLDVEWKPTFARGRPERKAAVLQLSGPGMCLVIQLFKLTGSRSGVPRSLKRILEDPAILKVGR